MGTLVEDIFLPSIDTFLVKTFNCSITTTAPRIKRHVGSDEMQIDIFVACEDKRVFFIEVKSNPNKVKYIDDFKEDLENFTKFFPEYADYTLIPIYAALNMPESIINRLKKEKIYAIVLKGDVLEIVNLDKISLA
jgi:hypothetical protein